jgi:hypothetical protein
MAEALNHSDPGLLYEQDFAAWLDLQLAALRERQFTDLDLDNLIEEVESIRRAEARAVEHHARVVVAQLLQLAHSTLSDPRGSWKSTASSHRDELETRLTPTLRQELEDRLEKVYDRGREIAATVLETEGPPAIGCLGSAPIRSPKSSRRTGSRPTSTVSTGSRP